MHSILMTLRRWLRSGWRAQLGADRGASLVEYALLVAFVLVVCVVAIGVIGTETQEPFSSAGSGFN